MLERALRLQWGKAIGFYLIWYGIGRTWFESIRVDPSDVYLGIRTNVWAALGAIVIGAIIIAVQSKRHTGAEPGVYVAGRGPADDRSVESDAVYSEHDDPGAEPEQGSDAEPAAPATSGAAPRS